MARLNVIAFVAAKADSAELVDQVESPRYVGTYPSRAGDLFHLYTFPTTIPEGSNLDLDSEVAVVAFRHAGGAH